MIAMLTRNVAQNEVETPVHMGVQELLSLSYIRLGCALFVSQQSDALLEKVVVRYLVIRNRTGTGREDP